jgi:hypothetical protein
MIYYHKLLNIIRDNKIDVSKYSVFIETGLCGGETISDLYNHNVLDTFKKVYSIEIQKHLIDICFQNFPFLNENKFNIIHGDSGIELPKICENHSDDNIFIWLDAHYSSGETGMSEIFNENPILGELDFIPKLNKKPIIIIDDTNLFGVENNWVPLEVIKEKINSFNFNFEFKINNENSYIIAY